MQSYIDYILTNTTKLTGIGFALPDDWLAAIILAGLRDEFRPFIMGNEAANTAPKSDVIIAKLLDTPQNTSIKSEALFSEGKTKGPHKTENQAYVLQEGRVSKKRSPTQMPVLTRQKRHSLQSR